MFKGMKLPKKTQERVLGEVKHETLGNYPFF